VSFLSPATFWGLAAAFPAVLAELCYRKWPVEWPWWYGLPAWIPMQLAIGYCIFRLVSVPSTTLLDAFVVWAFSTTAMRVAVSTLILGETIKGGTLFALGLLIMARIAQSFWGR
jgi:hypothetical protein